MPLPDPPHRMAAGALLPPEPEDDIAAMFFSFRGRLPRRPFWVYGVLGMALMQLLGYFLLGIAGFAETEADGLSLAVIAWPSLALNVKRWHDRDKSGWWCLINAVPVVGIAWTIVECGCLPGTDGANRFGPNPLRPGPGLLEETPGRTNFS